MSDKIRVGINGFGRIGRLVFRVLRQRKDQFEVVAVNDVASAATMAHLLKYDSTHGVYAESVETDAAGNMVVGGDTIAMLGMKVAPVELPWDEYGVDIVLESTGVFRKQEQVEGHFSGAKNQGVKKVLLSVPPKGDIDKDKFGIVVLGVNSGDLKASHRMVSNASCTTNCLAPVAKVLHENFGIKHGFMTTVHGYTNDQAVLDQPHSDLRRARTAATNIIPTTTGAAAAVGKVMPALNGKLDGIAMRVPVPNGSIVDLVVELDKDVTPEEVNAAVKKAAEGELKGILEYSEAPLVSTDIIGNPHSSVFDATSTKKLAGTQTLKILSWYDNEWGYSNRCVDLMANMMAL